MLSAGGWLLPHMGHGSRNSYDVISSQHLALTGVGVGKQVGGDGHGLAHPHLQKHRVLSCM